MWFLTLIVSSQLERLQMYGTDHNVVLANKMTRSGNEDHRGSGKVILPLETKHPCGSSRGHAFSFSKRIRSGNENILVAAVEVIISFGKQDDQRRLAAMLPAAIGAHAVGGHAASGDWRTCRQRRLAAILKTQFRERVILFAKRKHAADCCKQ